MEEGGGMAEQEGSNQGTVVYVMSAELSCLPPCVWLQDVYSATGNELPFTRKVSSGMGAAGRCGVGCLQVRKPQVCVQEGGAAS